ncbi:MAG: hypothetical protein DI542_18100 [Acinetobacter johnsonii]|uniref:Uncharacterized protein n=1 Tax=Acinetobacter johnsonii TaxID=40214 RepID=A0A2W5SWY5_ACIJO|nr:MAG: hypothetical protein DI542_18100 [Acinetobacter johnsonii]
MDIYAENDFLFERIVAIVKELGLTKDLLIDKIVDGLVPKSAKREFYLEEFKKNRKFLLEKFISDPIKTFGDPTDLNDVFRCILKILLSKRAYKKLLKKIGNQNISSDDYLVCYDPAKNGQNILKHGMIFHAVHSYSYGHFPLISPNRKGRQVLFTRYYFEGNNHIYICEETPDKKYSFVATVFDLTDDGKMMFITSRIIDLDGDIDYQLEMLISENKLNPNDLASLRIRALEVLRESKQYV